MSSPDGAPDTSLDDGPTDEEIAERAFELYLERGGEEGSEQDDWLQAERELRERRSRGDADRARGDQAAEA